MPYLLAHLFTYSHPHASILVYEAYDPVLSQGSSWLSIALATSYLWDAPYFLQIPSVKIHSAISLQETFPVHCAVCSSSPQDPSVSGMHGLLFGGSFTMFLAREWAPLRADTGFPSDWSLSSSQT